MGRPPLSSSGSSCEVVPGGEAVAVAFSMAWNGAGRDCGADGDAPCLLAGFRGEFYGCLTRRADALFEVADAVLCQDRKVTDLAWLSLVPEFRRGHGALYDGLNEGRADFAWLRPAAIARRLRSFRYYPCSQSGPAATKRRGQRCEAPIGRYADCRDRSGAPQPTVQARGSHRRWRLRPRP